MKFYLKDSIFTVIDEEDHQFISKLNLYISQYGYVRDRTMMHRMIIDCPKDNCIDHINSNRLDNRKCNLRITDNSKNRLNTKKTKSITSSKFKGVFWDKISNKWRSNISLNGKLTTIGYFEQEEIAAKHYDLKAKELFGEYAGLNFPEIIQNNKKEKIINLPKSLFSIIDEEDFEKIRKFTFHISYGYARSSTFLHRLLTDCPADKFVDHINGNRLDNRKENLRVVERIQNAKNRLKTKTKTSSKYKGVSWLKRNKKWTSQIQNNNKLIYLGSFDCEIDAALAYNCKALELFGEFASLNEIQY